MELQPYNASVNNCLKSYSLSRQRYGVYVDDWNDYITSLNMNGTEIIKTQGEIILRVIAKSVNFSVTFTKLKEWFSHQSSIYVHFQIEFDCDNINTNIDYLIDFYSTYRGKLILVSWRGVVYTSSSNLINSEKWIKLQRLVGCIEIILDAKLDQRQISLINTIQYKDKLILKSNKDYVISNLQDNIKVPFVLVYEQGNVRDFNVQDDNVDIMSNTKQFITNITFPIVSDCSLFHCDSIQIKNMDANNTLDSIYRVFKLECNQNTDTHCLCFNCNRARSSDNNINPQRCCPFDSMDSFRNCCAISSQILYNYMYHTYKVNTQLLKSARTDEVYVYVMFCSRIQDTLFRDTKKNILTCDIQITTL